MMDVRAWLIRQKAYGAWDRILSTSVTQILRHRGAVVGTGVAFHGRPTIIMAPDSMLTIGNRCTFISRPEATALGVAHEIILRTLRSDAVLSIGDDSGFSGVTICAAVEVRIGRGVLVGADVIIADTDFHPLYPNRRRASPEDAARAPVRIGDDVFIGARSIILKGVTVGAGAIIGAGSVVTADVAPMIIAAGNPARAIGTVPTHFEER